MVKTSKSKNKTKSFLSNLLTVLATCLLLFFIGTSLYNLYKEEFQEYYVEDEPKLQELYNILKPIFENPPEAFSGRLTGLNDKNYFDKIKIIKGKKSFTINKKVIHMCLKDENGEYYSNNTLLRVLLHEIAHSINTKSVGHDNNFHETLDELEDYASMMGVIDLKTPVVQGYCEYSPDSPEDE